VKIEIVDDKGAAFQGAAVLKEIQKLLHKEQILELFFLVPRRAVETEDVQ